MSLIDKDGFAGIKTISTVTIPDTIKQIPNGAFSNCSNLTSVSCADDLTSIGESAFENCTLLSKFSISAVCTSTGKNAFNQCTALQITINPESLLTIGGNALYKVPNITWNMDENTTRKLSKTEKTSFYRKATDTYEYYGATTEGKVHYVASQTINSTTAQDYLNGNKGGTYMKITSYPYNSNYVGYSVHQYHCSYTWTRA